MAVQQNPNSGTTTRGNKGSQPRTPTGNQAGQGSKAGTKGGPSARGAAGASAAETGERDETYNLVSVLYHALQGAETYGMYLRDAQSAGDEELVEFFSEVREEERDRAERAKELLAARLSGEGALDDDEDDEDDDEDDES